VFAVQATVPFAGASVKAAPARILVTFTQDVDASLVNDTTVTLERMRGAGESAGIDSAAAGGAEQVPATAALAPHNSAVVLLTPGKSLDPGMYRVTVRGTGGAALANMNAATLGANISFEFTVEPAHDWPIRTIWAALPSRFAVLRRAYRARRA